METTLFAENFKAFIVGLGALRFLVLLLADERAGRQRNTQRERERERERESEQKGLALPCVPYRSPIYRPPRAHLRHELPHKRTRCVFCDDFQPKTSPQDLPSFVIGLPTQSLILPPSGALCAFVLREKKLARGKLLQRAVRLGPGGWVGLILNQTMNE